MPSAAPNLSANIADLRAAAQYTQDKYEDLQRGVAMLRAQVTDIEAAWSSPASVSAMEFGQALLDRADALSRHVSDLATRLHATAQYMQNAVEANISVISH